jgi:hypothetical protein
VGMPPAVGCLVTYQISVSRAGWSVKIVDNLD